MGRPATGEQRKYSIQHMWDVHHEIVRLLVTGMKEVEIAQTLGVSDAMVSYTKNSPIVKRQLELLRAARDVESLDVAKRIQQIALDAVEVMAAVIESGSESAKLKAATDILDRAGFAAVKTIRSENLHAYFSADDLDIIKKRAKELAMCNNIIDVNTDACADTEGGEDNGSNL